MALRAEWNFFNPEIHKARSGRTSLISLSFSSLMFPLCIYAHLESYCERLEPHLDLDSIRKPSWYSEQSGTSLIQKCTKPGAGGLL
jgi:hypothetical protein